MTEAKPDSGAPAGNGFVTRFAPSPNGWLHLGHAYSALMAAHCAAQAGGTCLLRIEDIDSGRAGRISLTAYFRIWNGWG